MPWQGFGEALQLGRDLDFLKVLPMSFELQSHWGG